MKTRKVSEMSDQQRPPMPQMSGSQRPKEQNYEQEILEGGQKPPFVLTPEDKALFDKCNRDSFYQRSLPLSLLCAGTIMGLSHRGIITTGVKVKAFSAGFIGFIVGKASYASVLQEKFLTERPYSELSQIIRKNRGMPEIEIPPEYQTAQTDTPQPIQDNYKDYFQSKPEDSSSSQQGLSYDKLREEHQKRYKEIPVQEKEAPGFFIPQHELARLESGQNQPLWPQPSEVPHSSRQPKAASQPPASSGSDFYGQQIDEQAARRKTTNKYGDEVYE